MHKNIALVCFLIPVLVYMSYASTLENIIRRRTPGGHAFRVFIETCEMCGELYGNDLGYRCIMDRSYSVFNGCLLAVIGD